VGWSTVLVSSCPKQSSKQTWTAFPAAGSSRRPKTPDMRSGAVTSSRHAETAASPSDSHQPLAGEHSVGLAWSLAHRACWWSGDLIADGMLCPLWCGVSADAEV
jgi:hypothetical protein